MEIVNLSQNNFGSHGSSVTAMLSSQQSRIHTVDLSDAGCLEDESDMIKALTGTYSKIINVEGIKLSAHQIKGNAVNLLIQTSGISNDLLRRLAVKAQCEPLKRYLVMG